MKRVNTRGIQQANKCMIMVAVAYNLRKLIKFTTNKVSTIVKAMEIKAQKAFFKHILDKYAPIVPITTSNPLFKSE
jgi:hypothetical protein